MKREHTGRIVFIVSMVAALGAAVGSCGRKEVPYDTNLLRNPSFEDVRDGLPRYWELANFRGLEGQPEVGYGIDNTTAAQGQNSWSFKADPGTRRWYVLTQEVEVGDISQVRLRGWMQLDQVARKPDQYAQCNFLLTFFDEKHNRFQEMRFADKRTRLKQGTIPWFEEDNVFRVPNGTRYVAVSCILGSDGRVWFDNVSLSVPRPMDWKTQNTRNFVFHWLPDRPFPPGSIENEQRLFEYYEGRLGIESDVVVNYYLYPDTASIRNALSLKGWQYVSWEDQEIHTINPNENHEIIHFMTDPYGVPPKAIAEGTVFWLQGKWLDQPIDQISAYHLSIGKLPTIEQLTNYNDFANIHPTYAYPAAATFIAFIVERWGTERLLELYRQINGVNSYSAFAQAFERVYGVPCSEVEAQWRLVLSGVQFSDSAKMDPVP